METNGKLMAIAALIVTLTTPLVQAQSQPEPPQSAPTVAMQTPGPDPRMDGRPGGPGGRHGRPGPGQDRFGKGGRDKKQDKAGWHHAGGLLSLTTVTGTVGQFTGNDDFILDGFTLTGSGTATTVKFPPHLGQQVQKAIKAGSSVSVTGYQETRPQGQAQFRMNSLTVGKTTIMDTPPVRSTAAPETPSLVTATGKIADYQIDRGGRVNGLVLDDKTIVRIPAHVAYQLTDLAKKGSTITVQGYPRSLRDGQVQLEKANVLRASVLTINGQQYLVR